MSAAKRSHAGRRWGGGSVFFLRACPLACTTKEDRGAAAWWCASAMTGEQDAEVNRPQCTDLGTLILTSGTGFHDLDRPRSTAPAATAVAALLSSAEAATPL